MVSPWVSELHSSLVRRWLPLLVSSLLFLQIDFPFFWPNQWFYFLEIKTDRLAYLNVVQFLNFIKYGLCHLPLAKLLFSTFPFWSLLLWNCLESISSSSLTSDQSSSSSSLANFVTTVLVTWVSKTVVCWGLVENDSLTAACLARTGMALLVFVWTGTPWFRLGCCDFPLWCFGGSSSISVSSSDSSSELNGGVLENEFT